MSTFEQNNLDDLEAHDYDWEEHDYECDINDSRTTDAVVPNIPRTTQHIEKDASNYSDQTVPNLVRHVPPKSI